MVTRAAADDAGRGKRSAAARPGLGATATASSAGRRRCWARGRSEAEAGTEEAGENRGETKSGRVLVFRQLKNEEPDL